ncbi:MAG: alpha-amylase family glycosyl hydrolase [Candidatus Neomarinimicrobiota bacterium]
MKFPLKLLLATAITAILINCTAKDEENMLSYGAFVRGNSTTFRLLAPKAQQVYLVIFTAPEDSNGREYPMQPQAGGVWELKMKNTGYGMLYGYRLEGPAPIDPKIIVADPYTKAAVTQNSYRHVAKSLIVREDFDWEGDRPLRLDPRDAVIYEMHVRDLTADPTAGASQPGTYLGLVDRDQRGGIAHIKSMGFNAVELLPAMDFANVEVPFRDKTAPVYNTWNPYASNHWGYMTTFFFAPETYYASDGTDQPGAWNGRDGRAVREFKTMVKEFHKEGIAVLMDVVYNHVSNYDYHPFKYIDREKYFRLDKNGEYVALSGCGNDTRTEDPTVRRLILESVKYWLSEYHVDGFRFDLAYLIDKETCEQILKEARRINPDVIIIAEPWGGGYDPDGFSDIGWAAWNDKFRNGVKGQNPRDGQGFIFGKWQGENDPASLRRYVLGSPRELGGQYLDVAHSVNYLEAHDDNTMGDFIRLATGQVQENEIVRDRDTNARITGRQLALNKLAALYLLTSQGPVMIHEGQEWARSKVVAATGAPDTQVGQIDHNTYNKDNATNWLNWDERDQNPELVQFYRDLIALRKTYPEFRHGAAEDFEFIDTGKKTALAYILKDKFLVALNGQSRDLKISLPAGNWQVLADGNLVNPDGGRVLTASASVPGTSGLVLRKI